MTGSTRYADDIRIPNCYTSVDENEIISSHTHIKKKLPKGEQKASRLILVSIQPDGTSIQTTTESINLRDVSL